MSSDRYKANCKRCERTFEYGLFSRNYPYCADCKDELDAAAIRLIGEGKISWVEDRLDVPPAPRPKSATEQQEEYRAEDHRKAMDDYNRRNKP